MTLTELRTALTSGSPVFGTLIVSPSPRWPEVVAGCGLDFVFIDTEHIALDRAQLSWMCQTYRALGLPPVVRIPSPDPYQATMALDGGAAGIVVPYVESAAQVRALRGAVKLRPIKGNKLVRLLKGEPPEPALGAVLIESAANNLLVINIESVPAIDALDSILAEPGVDAVQIGPHDLSCSLGQPEVYDSPAFLQACGTIFQKARAAGVGAGIHFWGTTDDAIRFRKLGANMIIHSADISLFQKHLRLELAEIKLGRRLEAAHEPVRVPVI
jgi:2-keto-3-deoxy-L-rhamnonate aldolase RhmA